MDDFWKKRHYPQIQPLSLVDSVAVEEETVVLLEPDIILVAIVTMFSILNNEVDRPDFPL